MHAAVETVPDKEAERGWDFFLTVTPHLPSWRENTHFTSHSMLRSLWSAQSHLGNKGQCYLAIRESQSQLSPWLGPIFES